MADTEVATFRNHETRVRTGSWESAPRCVSAGAAALFHTFLGSRAGGLAEGFGDVAAAPSDPRRSARATGAAHSAAHNPGLPRPAAAGGRAAAMSVWRRCMASAAAAAAAAAAAPPSTPRSQLCAGV